MKITTKKWIELCFIVALCIMAAAAAPLSLCSALRPSSESLATWFQRSGAITSIFSTFAQYRLSAFCESIQGGTFAESWWLYRMFEKHYEVVSWALAIIAIGGALVWGYGDLFINNIYSIG